MDDRSVYRSVGKEEDLTRISRRVGRITVSAIKQMPVLASKVAGAVSLGQGIPSFATPPFVTEAVIRALREDESVGKYSLQPGLPALKEEIANHLFRTKGVPVDPDTEIFVSCGAMEALAASIATLVDRGDEVLISSPNYASHIEQVLFAEGVPVFVPLGEEQGWRLDIDGFKRAVTPRTKAILICNPMNPTGTVFSREEVRAIAELAIERDLFVIADEAYDFLVYEGLCHESFVSIPELKQRLVAAFSFSKMYCMTGWRVGYLYAPSYLIDQVLKVHDAFAICAPTVSQYGALAALRATNGKDGEGDRFIAGLVSALDARRELICNRLDRLSALFAYQRPQGAYYVFPGIALPGVKSMDLALRLLYEAKVISVPGSGFGPTGESHIRLSFGGTEHEINEGFDRIEAWLRTV
ncbi:MAG TPA: aminotransferase class I/II-fold pyridoxal phosphate-dependent enzyme [Syntrophorhabdales bacterium]|nr:aminotransferase class I/II-fold pyridoxal phosphate-dependent enzyme [Syntrophorhabdales bacterium]